VARWVYIVGSQRVRRWLCGRDQRTPAAVVNAQASGVASAVGLPGGGSRWVVAYGHLDRFKDLNDRHGHAAGDAALVAVASALSAVCNDTALAGRIGAEEFLIADLVKTEHCPQHLSAHGAANTGPLATRASVHTRRHHTS
jgi:hypothetical protein